MGLTERHWFENEDVPENYEWALEDAVYNSCTNKKPEDSALAGKGKMIMPDKDKVISAIEKAKEQSEKYGLDRILVDFKAADMILKLLKEQEPVEPISRFNKLLNETIYWCGKCEAHIEKNQSYCGCCGQEVKWND